MLWATNAATQSLGEEALVSFDTIVSRTNDSVAIVNDDQIMISKPGWYDVGIRGVFVNAGTSAALAGVQLLAGETVVPWSKATVNVPASGSMPINISMPVRVIPAPDGTAVLSWQMTDQATLRDVMLTVERII